MSGPYNGNAANYPTSITEPDDGDEIDAASVNVAIEGLADRTANLNARVGAPRVCSGGGPHQLVASDRYVVAETGGAVVRMPASPAAGQTHFIATTSSGTVTLKDSSGATITQWDGSSSFVTIPLIGIERCVFAMWNGNKWVVNYG